MTTVEFLAYLRSLDIQVIAEGDRLRCSAPEGVLTPELRSQLAEHKAELLAFLQHRQPSNTPSPLLQPVARDRYSPLSFAQQRLWFLHQLAPDNPFYNVPAAIRLNGHLNQSALEQAFNQIVHRHEALRTTFVKVNGQTMQAIAPHLRLPLPVVDLQALPTQEREAIAQQMATQEARHPFDLTTGPVLRVKLLQLAPTQFVLLLTLHHIVADGWSLGVFVRELSTLYTSLSQGQPAGLPELPIQYADFAHWQRQWLQGDVLESQLAYWREQLQNIPRLNLPSDRPRSPVQTYRGATQLIQLPPALTTALEGLSQQENVSLFMTLLAAFQTLLYRYTRQIDIAVGVPIANRSRRELEGLIGFFVNSLVLRTDLSGNPTFRELLGRVREVALGAYAHQDLPFEKLVEELDPERDLSHNPLFQVGFALQNAPVEPLELPGLSLQPMPFDPGTTRFDLEFHLWERSHGLNHLWQGRSDGLSGFVTYSTDLFDRATVLRMLGHFQTLLEGIVANPQGRLAHFPILPPAERQQLMEWNQTQAAYPQDTCWHHRFEAQVARSPETVAVVFETEQLTYRELNQRANQLAQYLQQLGVGPDVLVGLCVERSLAMAIGILGILKAGGAYVPLDPTYPRDRLQFMLADAQVPLLVTQSWLLPQLPTTQANVVCLDQQALLDSQSSQACCTQVTSDNLAYAIYTSGSTGQPKGVLIQHRGLCNVAIAQQVFNLQRQSRILQFSSLSFDASIFELLMAFSWGGTLYIPPKSARLPGTALVQFLCDNAITHAILPPAVLAVLPAADLPTLQTAISGGEACSREIVDLWAVDRQFFNAYGPTEVTIWATVARLSPGSGQPSIGRPIANTQIYLLDSQLQPVPIGVAGELYIGGDGLARGYLNRPELTAERFIPHPFAAEPGVRLYKTGDLARYRADGSLEFLGRIDDQVKIRGFRIELGEIETMLRQHPAVREAVAIVHANSAGDRRLIAYFTLNYQAEAQELWEQLQQQQVEQWQTLYNQTYHQASVGDPTFNINGWNSSYTGQPLPTEHMREWVSDRVQQILAFHPKRILEIGCGTGLLLFQIAPHCTQYWGTDFSPASLDYIQRQLAARELPQVKLLHRLATDFAGTDPAAFDVVILNSIVQYFPSLDYLLQVLEGAIQAVAPGGFLFIGDVRSLQLLSAFHTAVQLHQAEPTLERSQLQQRVQQAIFEEPELVIDPAFFYALRDRFLSIDRVQIRLARGCAHNELTQFRYNVLLHIAPPTKASNEDLGDVERIHWLNWTEHPLTSATACQYLVEQQPDILGITGVPNARVSTAVKAAAWLSDSAAPKTVERMREALEPSEQAIDPQAWWDLETELPYKVEICWSSSSPEGCYDVVFVRQGVELGTKVALPLAPQIERSRLWTTYTNHPLQAQFARQLIPQLRSYLGGKLPEYMVPAAWVPLESLPLTVNGKVDRRALPILDTVNATPSRYVAPRSPIEVRLVGIWTDLLRLKRVGVEDNFFELGGHSLLATQMASRIRDAFGIEVPLRSVFEAPTIAQLAKVIEHLQINQVQPEAPALVRLDRAAHRRLRSSLTNKSSDDER